MIDLDERNMMNRVMRLGDCTVDSPMTRATRHRLAGRTAPLADNLATMQETPFSRYLVYRGSDVDVHPRGEDAARRTGPR